MKIERTDKNSNINFKAKIIYNRKLILESLKQDKKLTQADYSTIGSLLDNVDAFVKMKENSIVEIFPRVDYSQVNLIGIVYDKSKKIREVIDLRSVRKMVADADFKERYLNSISALIKNVEKTKNGIDKIVKTVLDSKNIKGVFFETKKEPITLKNVRQCFEGFDFKQLHLACLKNDDNPTERIVKLFREIDKRSHNNELYIGILREKKKNIITYFMVESNKQNTSTQKKVLLPELFKTPLADRLL